VHFDWFNGFQIDQLYRFSRMVIVVIHNNFTNNVHYVLLSPPSPGVIPAGIKNLVKLNKLNLQYAKVSGTCGGFRSSAHFRLWFS
jgi:hypothetical protein